MIEYKSAFPLKDNWEKIYHSCYSYTFCRGKNKDRGDDYKKVKTPEKPFA